MYYLAPKCLYRGEYKRMLLRVLNPSWLWWCATCVPDVSPDIVLSIPFYSSKGRPRLQGVDVRVGLDRGLALTYSRPPYWLGHEPSCYWVLW